MSITKGLGLRWHYVLFGLFLVCSGAFAVQVEPRDLVHILKQSPFLAIVTITSTDMIAPSCFRSHFVVGSRPKGTIPDGPIWSNEGFRVGQQYLVFRSLESSRQSKGTTDCEKNGGWFIWGFGVGDALLFSEPFSSLDFQDGWVVVPYGFHEMAKGAHVRTLERRSILVGPQDQSAGDNGTELLINWPDLLRRVAK